MGFCECALDIIEAALKNTETTAGILRRIADASLRGKIAFYPCSRYTRFLLDELRKQFPDVFREVLGCFDRSADAATGFGVRTYTINKLDSMGDNISLLVVASGSYSSKFLQDIAQKTGYPGEILNTCNFQRIVSEMTIEEIMAKLKQVYDLLADGKSRMTYLMTWISWVLDDELPTELFEVEDANDFTDQLLLGCLLDGLSEDCKREFHAELYSMKYVRAKTGDVVLDVGAYKGDTALYFAKLVGDRGKVYSFEPVKANYDDLVKTVSLNGLQSIVCPVHIGCGRSSTTMEAVTSPTGSPWAFLGTEIADETVHVTSIDEFVRENEVQKVDFIKVDAEGMDYDVVLGAKDTLQRFHPRLAISLYHSGTHMLNIPLFIKEIGGYMQYVRCKIEGPWGITLYCVSN